MKVLAVVLFITAAVAAPQGVEIEEAAEVVPSRNVPGSPGSETGGDGFVLVMPRWNPFSTFFRNIFSRRPSESESEGGVVFDTKPEDQNGRGGFFSIIDSIFRLVPTLSENATMTFKNSSIEVINIGGVPMEVNRTIIEHTDSNGSVFRRVDQRILGPLENSTSTPSTVTDDQDFANELEDFEHSTPEKHNLQKRWAFTLNALTRHQDTPAPSTNHLDNEEEEEEEESIIESINNRVPNRGDGDIAINYLSGDLPHNPDAEIFDADLMRENERNFWNRRGNSALSQPMRSEPMRSEPMRSESMMSQPMRSQPMRSEPMRSQPMRSQPMRSEPMRSEPMMSKPMRSEPMRSKPMRSESMRSEPIRARRVMTQPMRTQPITSQPMRSEPIRARRVMSYPMRSQPMRSQPMRSQPMRFQSMRSEPMRARRVMTQPIRTHYVRI